MKTATHGLAFASIKELRALIDSKKISPKELLDYCSKRFAQYDPELQSALELFEQESVLSTCASQGILHGIPGLIKDNISQQDRTTACASRMLEDFKAVYDATVVARLKQEGALLMGRANCDEFAMGSSGETSAFAKTKNPWDLERVPGGSSSGSIAAVAAGLVPWALGTETGGSVRLPAAYCGIVGSKPTYGLLSRYGVVAYGSSLDQVGVATRTVHDNALVFGAIAGHDPKDSTSLTVAKKDYTRTLDGKLPQGLRIGVIENALHAPGMDNEVVAAIECAIAQLEKLGATIKRISMSTIDYSAATYFIISRAELASNLARYDGVRYGLRDKKAATLQEMYSNTRHDGFGQEVKTRILVGNYVLSAGYADAFYNNAVKVRAMMRKEFLDAFQDVDLLVMPTHPAPAFKFGAFDADKLQMDLLDFFTCSANLAGIPAISVPCGMSSTNLPIGFQFVGPDLSEELLFKTAHAYEQATQWHTLYPARYTE